MSDLKNFQSFAKHNENKIIYNDKVVIYTRVSDHKQKDNTSLDSQYEICTDFAIKKRMEIVAYFGGTHESAKTDERKHYQEMLKFVQQKKVANIIVYSLDRYSRTGGLAINTLDNLKRKGIRVLSVTQDLDPETPTGHFMQSFHLLHSRYDNDIRREKTIQGMRYRLLHGYWMGVAPFGYKNERNEDKTPIIVPNENAKWVQKAFKWKVEENLTNVEIISRLKKYGVIIYRQRLTDIFRNVVYCGLITGKMIEGQVIQGRHKALVSKSLFLKVNGIQAKHKKSSHNIANENLPLKGFAKCVACGSPLTGFIVKKKGIYYYKCKTTGCSCNRNTNVLHKQFGELLSNYEISKALIAPLKMQLKNTFDYFNRSNKDNTAGLKYNLKTINEKIDKLEERFVMGEIKGDLYYKFIKKYTNEKEEIEDEIKKNSLESSNLDIYIGNALELTCNLHKKWELCNYNDKQTLQKLLFPDGIAYNRKTDRVQTPRVNSILELTYSLSKVLSKKESEQKLDSSNLSALVTAKGLLRHPQSSALIKENH